MWSTGNYRVLLSTGFITLALHLVSSIPSQDDFRGSWPSNLAPQMKHRPDDLPYRLQGDENSDHHLLEGKRPLKVTKMSSDEGEKFFMEYWSFDDSQFYSQATYQSDSKDPNPSRVDDDQDGSWINQSFSPAFRPSVPWHQQRSQDEHSQMRLEAIISPKPNIESLHNISDSTATMNQPQKRDFNCPTGTNDCSAIGHPNSCCPTSDNCFAIQDTGLGSVGCCLKGSTCGGSIRNCDPSNIGCPASLGGGCCIQNYICMGVGCKESP